VIRILVQFLAQIAGVIIFRLRQPDLPRPFRMWLYPLPALLALAGFIYVLVSRKNFLKEVRYAGVLVFTGLIIYFIRARLRGEWPFASAAQVESRNV
jgi:APA family basic amino acid/polyamine antiporter